MLAGSAVLFVFAVVTGDIFQVRLAEITTASLVAVIYLIVVGSHRPTMATYLLGSNAKTIVRHAKCSVLVVRK
jgi:nucleotide-binding universal stress UspA family protein